MATDPGEDKKVETATFKYVRGSDYRMVAANGIYGGPLPSGEIKADFFVEFVETPSLERYKITEGRIDTLIDRVPPKGTWVRELQVGLLLSSGTAKSIADWLLEKVKIVEERAQKREQKSEPDRGKK